MIHLKPIRVNSSYFPDDYDEDKEKQDYDELDLDMVFAMYKNQFSPFFLDLLKIFPERMNQLISDYFDFINYNTPIDAETVGIGINNDIVAVSYNFVKDATGDYETLKEQAAQAIYDWINSFSSDNVKDRLAMFIATQITLKYANIVNRVAGAEQDYTDFMRIIANCLDLSLNGFYGALEYCCDHGDYNTWLDYEYKDEDTEDDVALYLADAFSANALWLACIYTSKFTSFEPENF